MNKTANSITNSIANITTINNQTAVIIATTISSAENTFTSLGGAIGNVTNSEDLNYLLNEATNHSYQNMQNQTPILPSINTAQSPETTLSSSNLQPAQNIPSPPIPKRQLPKQPYSKPHSTTRTASASQQNLIKNLCQEKGKDLVGILAPYGSSLSQITSAQANQIIQEIKNNAQ